MATVSKAFSYQNFFPGRKTARKSKPPQGIIVKKRKLESDAQISSSSSSSSWSWSMKVCKRIREVGEYRILKVISHGSYGIVYRARSNTTGETVAIKEGLQRASSSLSLSTEIEILKPLPPHPSIIGFKKVVVDGSNGVYIVMEYLENDLRGYMNARMDPFTMNEVKLLMKQLIQGVKFLHDNHVMHRDLKPSNILVNNRGELKICDFGLSRRFPSLSGSYCSRVGTRWYKAPELLLGDRTYSCAIDMWSVGCVMGELLLKEALFRGQSVGDQLDKIFGIVGTPDEAVWPGFRSLAGSNAKFVEQPNSVIRSKFSLPGVPVLDEAGFDLLERLLTCNPVKRITAESALSHAWFNEY